MVHYIHFSIISIFIFTEIANFNLDLTHPILLGTFISYNILAYFVTSLIIGKILSETPGDLIYNRV